MTDTRIYMAIYGNVRIPRAYCYGCEGFAFIIGGSYACCGDQFEIEEIRRCKRMCHPEDVRKLPPPALRKFILSI